MEKYSLRNDLVPIAVAVLTTLGFCALLMWGTIGGGFDQIDEEDRQRVERLVQLQYGSTER